MSTSDFLTILGLALAVWAIIPNKERRFLLLFFSNWEIRIIVMALLYIHFLMAFDWLHLNWFTWLSIFTIDKGIPSSSLAYIFALIIIIYPVQKVYFGYFSRSRLDDLIALYRTLIKESEIDILVNYIKKYHINDIEKYLIGESNLPQPENSNFILRGTELGGEYESLVKPKRMKFAENVYGVILKNELFIQNAANKYPELFAQAIGGMKNENTSDQDFVKFYIKCLFDAKNQLFVEELRTLNEANDSIQSRVDNDVDVPIISSLFINTKAASGNYVWGPVGDGAVKSLKYDDEQKEYLVRKYEHDLDNELWGLKIHIAIVYFNYMVRETIYRDSEWHMWLFYYKRFVELLINIIPIDYDLDDELVAHKLISDQISIIIEWLDLAKDLDTENRVIDAVRCLGGCIYSIILADEGKLSLEYKKTQLDSVLTIYFELSNHPENKGAKTAREWLDKLFKNPKGVDFGKPSTPRDYLNILQETWNNFDKVPYEYQGKDGSIQYFITNILEPLGLKE